MKNYLIIMGINMTNSLLLVNIMNIHKNIQIGTAKYAIILAT